MYEFWVAHQHRHMFHISDLLGTAVTKAHVKLHRWLVWRPQPNSWFHMISPLARLGPPLHWQKRDTQWSAWPSLKNKTIKMLYNGWTWLLNKCQTWWTTCSDSTGVRKSWNVMKCHEMSWNVMNSIFRWFQKLSAQTTYTWTLAKLAIYSRSVNAGRDVPQQAFALCRKRPQK